MSLRPFWHNTVVKDAVKEWLEGQTEEFYLVELTVCQKNVANAVNSVVIILKNKVQFVTFPFFFMVEIQNFLNALGIRNQRPLSPLS